MCDIKGREKETHRIEGSPILEPIWWDAPLPATTNNHERGTQTARRIVTLLKLLAAHQGKGLRFTQVADMLGLQRSTAHRLLKILDTERLIYREHQTKRYFLGPLIYQLGLVAGQTFNLQDICAPSLQRLADRTHDTAFLFARSGIDAVCIGRVQGDHPIQTPSVPLGGRQPLGVNAGGLALLSALSDDEIENILTANLPYLLQYGGLTKEQLFKLIEQTRCTGYALIGECAVPGVTAVGVAICNHAGLPLAALTVATTTERMTKERQDKVVPFLNEEKRRITELLSSSTARSNGS